jgi:hypothetical protein
MWAMMQKFRMIAGSVWGTPHRTENPLDDLGTLSRMTRPAYDALPEAVRSWADGVLGSPVVTWSSETGGFSPGVAARVGCADGTRAFVKAVSSEVNPHTPDMHRTEARVTATLPPSLRAPRLLAAYDDGTWVALLLEEVPGRAPAQPWLPGELAAAMRALDRLAQVPATADLPLVGAALHDDFSGWRTLAAGPPDDLAAWQHEHLDELAELESHWAEAASGDRLLHLDARADNMLITADGEVVLVDWPWAAAGDPVMDVVGFIPSAVMNGAGDPEELLAATVAGRAADPDAVTALVAAFSGLMESARRKPPPPGIPRVRALQARQAEAAGRWLRARTGW